MAGKILIGNVKGVRGERGEQGVQGIQGPPYALTDADRDSIAGAVKNSITTADISGAADTNYTSLKARAASLNASETNPTLNGAIAWNYE